MTVSRFCFFCFFAFFAKQLQERGQSRPTAVSAPTQNKPFVGQPKVRFFFSSSIFYRHVNASAHHRRRRTERVRVLLTRSSRLVTRICARSYAWVAFEGAGRRAIERPAPKSKRKREKKIRPPQNHISGLGGAGARAHISTTNAWGGWVRRVREVCEDRSCIHAQHTRSTTGRLEGVNERDADDGYDGRPTHSSAVR